MVLFDVWGERIRSLGKSEVKDVDPKGELLLDGTWLATQGEAEQMETVVAFVDRVLLANGSVWRADRASIMRRLAEVQLKIPESWITDDGPVDQGKRV